MKNTTIILYLIFHIPYFGFSQPNIDKKRDMNWLIGSDSPSHTNPDYTIFGNTITNFNYCTRPQYFKYMPIDFFLTAAAISDTSGRLLFYTNGYTICDSTHQIMQNGDSLCVGQYGSPKYEFPRGSNAIQGAMILPKPSSNNLYYLLHNPAADNSLIGDLKYLNITTIDMNLNNAKGAVISKEVKMIRDDAHGYFMKACRHANGRDWWIIRPNIHLTKYYRLLVSPNGIDSLTPQIMSAPFSDLRISNSVEYSPDGSQFAHKVPQKGIFLYDFDRCNGMVSNRRYIPRVSNYFGEVYAGICFSPDSRYLYCTNDTSVTQYDTYAADIPNSATIVGVWDRTILNTLWQDNTKFFQMMNAPDGKIYITGPGGTLMWHTIHNPNGVGAACDLRLHDVLLPTFNLATTPNFPNFRLGALRGSPCDTLGIEEGAAYVCVPHLHVSLPRGEGDVQMRVFPNPTSDESIVTCPIDSHGILRIYNLHGQIIQTIQNPFSYDSNYSVSLKNAPAGLYILEYRSLLYGSTRAKLVKQ